MKINKIYFDMDGVLADFRRGVEEICRMPFPEQGIASKAEDDMMWERIRESNHFYARLAPIPEAEKMVNILSQEYPCAILSAIPKLHRGILTAEEDKRIWVNEYFSYIREVNICLKEEKKKKAKNKGCILVDDLVGNIEEWEKAGGTGIVFKGPEETLNHIRLLESLGAVKISRDAREKLIAHDIYDLSKLRRYIDKLDRIEFSEKDEKEIRKMLLPDCFEGNGCWVRYYKREDLVQSDISDKDIHDCLNKCDYIKEFEIEYRHNPSLSYGKDEIVKCNLVNGTLEKYDPERRFSVKIKRMGFRDFSEIHRTINILMMDLVHSKRHLLFDSSSYSIKVKLVSGKLIEYSYFTDVDSSRAEIIFEIVSGIIRKYI